MKTLNSKEEIRQYEKECCSFKKYDSIEEYIEDIVTLLVYSPWHYSEERARELVDDRMEWVKKFYKDKTPADDASADIGFCCG